MPHVVDGVYCTSLYRIASYLIVSWIVDMRDLHFERHKAHIVQYITYLQSLLCSALLCLNIEQSGDVTSALTSLLTNIQPLSIV